MTEKDLETVQEPGQTDAPVESQSDNAGDDVQKPVFNRVQMQDAVNREKAKALERGKELGRKEALMELQQQQGMQQQQPEQQSQAAQQPQGQVTMGGMQQLSPADVQRMMQEQLPQMLQGQAQQYKNEQAISSFVNKMQVAEQKYPGLEKELNELDYDQTTTNLIMAVNDLPNSAEVMKELVMDNPLKMGGLLSLMKGQPRKAIQELSKLSNSIQVNEQAKAQEAQSRDPMNQLKPSFNAATDSSDMSVNDLRKMFSRQR